MKTKEELNAMKEEVETLNKKLAELTEDELAQVTGGCVGGILGISDFGGLVPVDYSRLGLGLPGAEGGQR